MFNYRRKHEDGWGEEQSEALAIGQDFHTLLDKYYKQNFLREKSNG